MKINLNKKEISQRNGVYKRKYIGIKAKSGCVLSTNYSEDIMDASFFKLVRKRKLFKNGLH